MVPRDAGIGEPSESWGYHNLTANYFEDHRNCNCPNVSTTPIMAMGCRQCLSLSVVQLKGKHCRKPHCRNGVVDTFGQELPQETQTSPKYQILKCPSQNLFRRTLVLNKDDVCMKKKYENIVGILVLWIDMF